MPRDQHACTASLFDCCWVDRLGFWLCVQRFRYLFTSFLAFSSIVAVPCVCSCVLLLLCSLDRNIHRLCLKFVRSWRRMVHSLPSSSHEIPHLLCQLCVGRALQNIQQSVRRLQHNKQSMDANSQDEPSKSLFLIVCTCVREPDAPLKSDAWLFLRFSFSCYFPLITGFVSFFVVCMFSSAIATLL